MDRSVLSIFMILGGFPRTLFTIPALAGSWDCVRARRASAPSGYPNVCFAGNDFVKNPTRIVQVLGLLKVTRCYELPGSQPLTGEVNEAAEHLLFLRQLLQELLACF